MKSKETLVLMWSDFQKNVTESYQNVRQSQDLSDVSLACDDEEGLVEAHRVILAAGSSFFQQVLSKRTMGHPHPLLYLAGVKRIHLESILEFLYCGQARMPRDQLMSFLETAKTLGIKGLEEEETQENTNYFDKKKSIKVENIVESKETSHPVQMSQSELESSLNEDVVTSGGNKGIPKTSLCKELNLIDRNKSGSKTSLIWSFMELTEDAARAKCNICGKIVLTQKGVTSNLLLHIKVAHRGSEQANLLHMQSKLKKEKKVQKMLPLSSQDQESSA